jgi:uncharacterized membrane protein
MFLVSLLLLFLFHKTPVDNLTLAFTRTILEAFPASFAATAVDLMNYGAIGPPAAPYSTQALI